MSTDRTEAAEEKSMDESWVPTVCTLPTPEQPLRVAEFDALFATALTGVRRQGPTHAFLDLEWAPGRVETVRELAERETHCCSFFAFGVTEGQESVELEIRVPASRAGVLEALLERSESAAAR